MPPEASALVSVDYAVVSEGLRFQGLKSLPMPHRSVSGGCIRMPKDGKPGKATEAIVSW